MTKTELEQLSRGIAPVLREYMGKQTSRLDSLERRLAEIESRPSLKWAGTFKGGESYPEASLTTHGGSLWLALGRTSSIPGSNGSWRLVVKRGEYGR